MTNIHFESIYDYLESTGKPKSGHPLFAIVRTSTNTEKMPTQCYEGELSVSANFYIISFKKVVSGKILYGQTEYDCQQGTLIFLAPNQTFSTQGVKVESSGIMLLVHKDFMREHNVLKLVKSSSFFDYATNEALHVSSQEEASINAIFQHIEQEIQTGYDEHSRDIVLSHINTLLTYSTRFYRRQFIQRQELQSSIYQQLRQILSTHFHEKKCSDLPQVADIALQMNMTSRYLSDALKAETGKSCKEWIALFIVDLAKDKLQKTNDSVATIAYSLGFDYPQYFARLFKNKVGLTPTEFRNKLH